MARDENPLTDNLGRAVLRLSELERIERQARAFEPSAELARLAQQVDPLESLDHAAREMLKATRPPTLDVAVLPITATDTLRELSKQLAEPTLLEGAHWEAQRATEALQESAAAQLVRGFETGLRELLLPSFGHTVLQIFQQEQQAREEMLQDVCTNALVETLDTLLNAHGLSSWAEEIAATLGQPQWEREIQQAAELFGDIDLQLRLAEELYLEPDWRTLMDRTMAGESIDSDAAEEPAPVRKEVRLREQANRALSRALPSKLLTKRIRNAVGGAVILAGFANDYLTNLLITSEHSQREAEHGELAEQHRRLQFAPSWTLGDRKGITLRSQPLSVAVEQAELIGPARLIEVRRTTSWIQVEAWDCHGQRRIGWIQAHETIGLEAGNREICRPNNVPPQLIVDAGTPFIEVWHELFTAATISGNTRQAHEHACRHFFESCRIDSISLADIQASHVSAWRDALVVDMSMPVVRQSVIALRRLFDALVARELLPTNPV